MDINPSALCLALSSDLADYFTSQSYLSLPDHTRSVQAAAAFNLQQSLVAKLGSSETTEDCDAKAFAKWSQANEKCALWEPPVMGVSEVDDLLWGEFKESVYWFFRVRETDKLLIESLSQIALKGANGPGASNRVIGTSHYEKLFVGGLTTSSEILYSTYREVYSRFPGYLAAVDYGAKAGGEPVELQESCVFFVPKNADISRLAATEPSLNMFYQKGASSFLEDRLAKYFGLNLSTQPERNRRLAQLGSIDGSFATIDLSSASDSISHKLVKSVVPRGVYDILARIRTPNMSLKDGELVPLNMFSTMGNGFTFSLETVLFACIVQAAYRICGITPRKGASDKVWAQPGFALSATQTHCGNYAVFGDDIIVKREAYAVTVRLLTLCGFTVNRKKTFVEGPFRESCGGDYFHGHLVRGVFIKLLETHNHVYHAINSLVDWSTEHAIPLIKVVRLLLRAIPNKEKLYVPPSEQTDAGLRVPLEFFEWGRVKHPLRTDPDVGVRYVYRASIPKVLWIRTQRMELLPWIAFIRLIGGKRRDRGGLVYNELGMYQCLLSGHIANGRWAVRQLTPTYRTAVRIVPNWHSRNGASEDWLGLWATMVLRHIL